MRRTAGLAGDLWTKLSGREGDVNSAATTAAAQQRNFQSLRAQQELGYRWRPLAESAEDAWTWFREYGYA
jgi:dihydroflavonol-4-reductase